MKLSPEEHSELHSLCFCLHRLFGDDTTNTAMFMFNNKHMNIYELNALAHEMEKQYDYSL